MTNGELSVELLKQDWFETNTSQNEFLNTNIINKSDSDITQILESYTPTENGGRVALSGFYFQFMVSLDYLSQLIEGKWDFLAIEYHDDIIVGRDDAVRFIQVKSSSDDRKVVTEIGELYTRKKVTENGIVREKGNSWVDKLISKGKFFKDMEGVRTEFELVTNYDITDGTRSGLSVLNYIDNRDFQMEVDGSDGLLLKLSNDFITIEDDFKSYSDYCGEDIKELLSRFHISIKQKSSDYLTMVSNHLSGALDIPIVSDKSHIDSLIGILCARCTTDDPNVLFINKDIAQEILAEFKRQLCQIAEEWVASNGNSSLARKALQLVGNDFTRIREEKIRTLILTYFNDYIEELLSCVEVNNITITQLVSRYMVGRKISCEFEKLEKHDLENYLHELVMLLAIINIIYDKTNICGKYSTILVQEAIKESIQYIALYKVEPQYSYIEAVENLKSIIKGRSSAVEQLHLLQNEVVTILQGEVVDDEFFNDIRQVTIEQEDLLELRELLKKEESILKVPLQMTLVPGLKLMGAFKKIYQLKTTEDLENLIDSLRRIWFHYSRTEGLG